MAIGPTRRSLRSVLARPRTPPRAPARPGAGPLKTGGAGESARSGSTAAPVVRLWRPWWHAGRRGAAARFIRPAALQPLRQASWHIGRDAAPPVGRWQPVRQSSHPRSPHGAPVDLRGGLVGGSSSGGPGNRLTASAAKTRTHPQPLPSRWKGPSPTPRPPQGGCEGVRARGSASREPRPGPG